MSHLFLHGNSTRAVWVSLGAGLTALLLTIAFHFLVADRFYGVGFAIFLVFLVIGTHILAALEGARERNRWAYLFLLPLLCAILGEAFYASSVVRGLAPAVAALSLVFFTYWFMAPRVTFCDLKSLWHRSLFFESIIPVDGSSGLFSSLRSPRHGIHILLGIVIAIPVLLLFLGLFASADPLFRETLRQLVAPVNYSRLLFDLVIDVFVALYLGRLAWSMITRARDGRSAKGREWNMETHHVTLYTFLSLVNVLFLIFIGFQFVYFFGGAAAVEKAGLTYAAYAREGFFQLLFVSAIVFVLVSFVYRITRMREAWIKGLSVVFMAQTGVVIASAIRRLTLYIDAYGLSVSRFWAMFVILLIAAVLIAVTIGALVRISYQGMAKVVCIGILFVVSGMLVVNVEGSVARHNVERYRNGRAPSVDMDYLRRLSSDAIPEMVDVITHDVKGVPVAVRGSCLENLMNWFGFTAEDGSRACARNALLDRGVDLQKTVFDDWRNAVWSDYRALAALANLK